MKHLLLVLLVGIPATIAIFTLAVAFAFFASLVVGYDNLVFGFTFLLSVVVILGCSLYLSWLIGCSILNRLFPA